MKRRSALLPVAALVPAITACGMETAGERVPVRLSAERADAERSAQTSELVLQGGVTLHLEEASVLLGPIYLRAPKKSSLSLYRLLLPVAHAHGAHAQTLTEGQVMGEWLQQAAFDALSEGERALGDVASDVGTLDRLSIMLDRPRSRALGERTRQHHVFVRGTATLDERSVRFRCGLDIGGDADDTPENLEARRRVDQIPLRGEGDIHAPAQLRLGVNLARWFEFVDFDALPASDTEQDVCATSSGGFAGQLYLGVRRPEAFTAELLEHTE